MKDIRKRLWVIPAFIMIIVLVIWVPTTDVFSVHPLATQTPVATIIPTKQSVTSKKPMSAVSPTPATTPYFDANGEYTYRNEELGFSFKIPKSWKDMFRIEESSYGIYVFFQPIHPPTEGYGHGLLFGIVNQKEISGSGEGVWVTVGSPRKFTTKGETYIVGGFSDVAFDENHVDYKDYSRVYKEISAVVATIKAIE